MEQGNTVIVTERHLGLIASADHIIDLGLGSGNEGGNLVAAGLPENIMDEPDSLTGKALRAYLSGCLFDASKQEASKQVAHKSIGFKGVCTHNLKNIDVVFPLNKITAVTSVSGSGKSSLAFDTLHACGRNRFLDSFSPYVRSQVGLQSEADFEEVNGITPSLAINRQSFKTNPRSTVGTVTGIYDLYRLLFSRAAKPDNDQPLPYFSMFSFNHRQGACKTCDGLGDVTVCDPGKLVFHPALALGDGAMNGHKSGKFYGDPNGQYLQTLFKGGERFEFDFSKPWIDLDEDARHLAMYRSGEEIYEVNWKFKRDKSQGEHQFEGVWKGFANIVNEEYQLKHADHRGESMLAIMKKVICHTGTGSRLNVEALAYTILGVYIAGISSMSVAASIGFFCGF